MKKAIVTVICAVASILSYAQCTTTNATSCTCPPNGGTDCDLLPDIVISRDALAGSGGYTEYPQYNAGTSQSTQGSDDGRLRITGSTPNIGYGPIEVRGINKWVCGTDTFTTYPGAAGCANGSDPLQVVVQRVYHKNGTLMQYSDKEVGTMTYHPTHAHQHVNDWGIYTLRLQNPNEPDPLKWPIVGKGSKLAYCLMDLSSCNTSTGWCRDDNNTTLNSTNLPNYGLGGGVYGCSNTLQGISAGYVDTYSKSLDGMWINIPLGTCNGNYYIVVHVDPKNNFREQREDNNVLAFPITLTRQTASGSGFAEIIANRPPAIATGDSVTLTANTGFSYLWSNGATTQSITTSTSGTYTVSVTGPCGTAVSVPFTVSVTPLTAVSAPVTTSATRCGTGSVTLTATGTGTIRWFNSSTGGTLLATGTSFSTPSISSTTTYYAECVSGVLQPVNSAGPAASTIGTSVNYTGTTSQYLVFDAYSPFTLQTVKVYASTTASRTFTLLDKNLSTIRTTTVSVAAGTQTVTLNWNVPVGDFYRLQVSGTSNLTYNTSGVTYPYTVPGILQIHNSSGGHSQYFYCYDWKVKAPDIVQASLRTPATATVTAGPAVSFSGLSASYPENAPSATLTGNPSGGIFSGPGIVGNTFTPSLAGVGGPYTITYNYTDLNNCSGSQSQTTSVTAVLAYNCATPTGVTVTNITGTTARVNWTGSTAPQFRIRYRKVGATNYSTVLFNWTSGVYYYTLTGLRKNTSYETAIQAVCSGSTSTYSTNVTFRTTSAAVRLADGGTPVSELSDCLLFPNPVVDRLEVKCTNLSDEPSFDYRLTDLTGRIVREGVWTGEAFDVSGMNTGVYLLQLSDGNDRRSFRFMKQ